MNNYSFQDIAKGKYGRKIAYTSEEFIDESNVVSVLADTLGTFIHNKAAIQYLWDYKNGDQPIRYRKKTIRDDVNNIVVENHAYEIVRFKNGQTFGEPVQFVSTSKDEKVNESVELLNKLMRKTFKQRKDIDSGEWTSAVGTGFKAVGIVPEAEIPFCITVPTPMNTYIVYSEKNGEPMMAVQELKDSEKKLYYLCYTKTHEYRIQNSKLVTIDADENGTEIKSRLHVFGGIPIVEIPNNQSRISDIELVIDILDALNNMQSNRMDAIEQFVQSWVKFVNCDVDEETFNKMKTAGALVVKSNNGSDNKADVDIMSQELNQQQSQIAKDDLWDNALSILAIPNRSDGSGDRQGATFLKNGWDFSKQSAMLKDAYVVESETRLAEIVLNILRVEKGSNYCPLSTMDFEVNIVHSPTDNLQVKTQSLQMLLAMGISPLVAIKTSGLWSDAEKVFNLSKPYLDNLYKTIDDAIEEQGLQDEVEKAQELLNQAM